MTTKKHVTARAAEAAFGALLAIWATAPAGAGPVLDGSPEATPRIEAAATPETVPAPKIGFGGEVAQADAPHTFDIPAGPLGEALVTFGAQSGVQVAVGTAAAAGKSAPAVSGTMTARVALRRLLESSGLTYEFTSAAAVSVDRPDGEGTMLAPITVEGQGTTPTDTKGLGYSVSNSTTATKTDLSIIDTPQSIQVVPRDVLDDEQAKTLDEALARVSGIVQANTFGNTTDRVLARGFGDADIFYRDGARSIVYRYFNANVDRVEVLKGPSSLLYGRLEPGGLINVITKKPLEEYRNEISFQGGNPETKNGFVDVTGPIRKTDQVFLGYRLVAELEESDYWRNFGEIRKTIVTPTLRLRAYDFSADVQYEYEDSEEPFDRGTIIVGDAPAPVLVDRRFGEEFEKLTSESHMIQTNMEYAFSDNLKLRTNGSWQIIKSDDLQARPRSFNETTGILTRRVDGTVDRKTERYFVSTNMLAKVDTGPVAHELLFGADYETHDEGRGGFVASGNVANFNIYAPVYGLLNPASATASTTGRYSNKEETYGYYVQDIISLTDAFKVILGARYEQYSNYYKVGNNLLDDSEGNAFLPRAGIVYRPAKWLSVYGNYSQSFQPNQSTPEGDGPFDPEEGVTYEAGFKTDLAQGLTSTVSFYKITKQNVLATVNDTTSAIGEVESHGVEVDVTGQVLPNVDVIASYAFTDTQVTKDDGSNEGNEFLNVPRHAAGVFATYDFTGKTVQGLSLAGLRAGGGVRYVGERPGDSGNTFVLPEYMTVDAFAGYELPFDGKKFKLQFNVKNLFDQEYYPSSGGNLRINVGASRSFLLRASAEF